MLIAAASTSLNPVASLLEIRSDPAKSTSVRRPRVVTPDTKLWDFKDNKSKRWDRELCKVILFNKFDNILFYLLVFILVEAVVLFFSPTVIILMTSSIDCTSISVRPYIMDELNDQMDSVSYYLLTAKLRVIESNSNYD